MDLCTGWTECTHSKTAKGGRFIMETLQRKPPHKQAWKKRKKISSGLICQGTCKYRLNRIIQSINFHGTGEAAGSLPTRRCCKAQGKAAEFRVADISEGQRGCRLKRRTCAKQTRVNTALLNPYPTRPKGGRPVSFLKKETLIGIK